MGNIIYKNGVLYQIGHDEGRVVNGVYEYDIRDHLGSLRVSFKDSVGIAKITQANSYGIFGEELPSLSYKNTPNLNNYKFTDKENLPETGYTDFGARFYDNLVPRFISIDPLAETSRRFSPYTYGNNNPIRFIDPDGMEAEEYQRTNVQYSNGYTTSNSRDNTGAVTFEGAYLNADGGGGEGNERVATNNDDKPKVKSKDKIDNYDPLIMKHSGKFVRRGSADPLEQAIFLLGLALDIVTSGGAELIPKAWLARILPKSFFTKAVVGLSDNFFASTIKPWGDQGLTVIGRALQKHAGREGSVFQNIKFSHKTANQDALNILDDIINSNNKIIKEAKSGGKYIFDKDTGRGFGVSREGLFNGFRELD